MPSHVGTIGATWRIRLNLCFLRSTRVHNPNGKSTRSAVLAELTAETSYTYNGLFFPQTCPLAWGIWTPSNTWFPGPTRVLNPNGISIGSAVLQSSLVWETDKPHYSVGNNRPHTNVVRAMRSKTCIGLLLAARNKMVSLYLNTLYLALHFISSLFWSTRELINGKL